MTEDRASLREAAARQLSEFDRKIAETDWRRAALERERGSLCDRLAGRFSLREIAEMAGGVSHNTVKNWIEKARSDGEG